MKRLRRLAARVGILGVLVAVIWELWRRPEGFEAAVQAVHDQLPGEGRPGEAPPVVELFRTDEPAPEGLRPR